MNLRLLSYSKSGNIGDAIQTFAMQSLINNALTKFGKDIAPSFIMGFVDRDNPTDADIHSEVPVLVNGYLDGRWSPVTGARNAFIGVHTASQAIADTVKSLSPDDLIGARDPFSNGLMEGSVLSGCATMCLPPYEGTRRGIYLVDVPESFHVTGGTRHTHNIGLTMPWQSQLTLGLDLLQKYQKAEAVYTTRLHALLPCLAMGTPVALITMGDDMRFGIAKSLGVSVRTTAMKYPHAWLSAESIALRKMVGDLLTTITTPAPAPEPPPA